MATLPSPSPLQSVQLVFRSKFIQLSAILQTTSAFLDSAVEMEFCKACKLNSIALLDRIWTASLPDSEPSPAELGPGNGGTWSRRKYLRTDRHYNQFQFRRAMVKAVELKDPKDTQEMIQ
ncbi:hypothetical protein PHMEG_00039173 [Phytophthora megakarya]|uniref:Uncharacterized protein n=1 Tax=Phytophthora megakarya TaxID=4795 RepID=A0A225UFK4_9STRA|nr:hypothetical protein PHMEG_00039173 [Phytophthora megakarya]